MTAPFSINSNIFRNRTETPEAIAEAVQRVIENEDAKGVHFFPSDYSRELATMKYADLGGVEFHEYIKSLIDPPSDE